MNVCLFSECGNVSYILRVLQWARKYGIRVNLDLHTIPGSQNGMWQGASLMLCILRSMCRIQPLR